MNKRFECIECGTNMTEDVEYCDRCFFDLMHEPEEHTRRMSRHDRYQAMADHGIDTWEDYRDER